jgi:hypothetical protein
MSDPLFKLFVIFLLGANFIVALSASRNAREAHIHAHELACYVQAADLCKFYEVKK